MVQIWAPAFTRCDPEQTDRLKFHICKRRQWWHLHRTDVRINKWRCVFGGHSENTLLWHFQMSREKHHRGSLFWYQKAIIMSSVYYSINLADFYWDQNSPCHGEDDDKENFKSSFCFLARKFSFSNLRFHLKLFNQRGSPWESKPLTACIRSTEVAQCLWKISWLEAHSLPLSLSQQGSFMQCDQWMRRPWVIN